MTQPPVTLVTRNAMWDDLSADDYQAIYDELRPFDADAKKRLPSIRPFCELIGWDKAPANWTNWEQGQGNLTRAMRNALRRAVGKAELPMTLTEAVTAGASQDASVWSVGEGVAEHVIMVADGDPVTLHVNGSVSVVRTAFVTEVTGTQEKRRRYWRTCMSLEQKERTEALNQGKPPELQVTPQEIYDMGLKACGVTE
jgi:hypothetical protein